MSVSRVREIGALLGDQQHDLARVFVNAFDDGGSKFPIDFDSLWRFLNYSTKGNALQKLKRCFLEGEDYIVQRERVVMEVHNNLNNNLQGSPVSRRKSLLACTDDSHACLEPPQTPENMNLREAFPEASFST